MTLAYRMLIGYIVARESPKPMQGEDDDDELNQIRSDRDEQAKCERISQLHDGYRHNARIARGLGALSRRDDPGAVRGLSNDTSELLIGSSQRGNEKREIR